MAEDIVPDKINKQPDRKKEAQNSLVFSYLTLRNLIGISGLLLPVVLLLTTARTATDRRIEPTISDYYYSSNGDILVVLLSVLSVFLITYKGYTRSENVLTTLAAIGGLGVAFSPTATTNPNSFSIHFVKSNVPTFLGLEKHFVFAALFFIAIAVICLKYFPRSDKNYLIDEQGKRTQKAKRNIVYKICGWLMVLCVILIGIYFVLKPIDFPVVFVLETIAIEAFGIAWITKGETLWPDGEHYIRQAYRTVKQNLLH